MSDEDIDEAVNERLRLTRLTHAEPSTEDLLRAMSPVGMNLRTQAARAVQANVEKLSLDIVNAVIGCLQDAGGLPEPSLELLNAAGRARIVVLNMLGGMSMEEALKKVPK